MRTEPLLAVLDDIAAEVSSRLGGELPAVAAMFRGTFRNTLATTVRPAPDGTVYVITGDIPAMWLRDSTAQVRPYLLPAAEHAGFADLLVGVSRRQFAQVAHDPYANAFNETPSGACFSPGDGTGADPLVWERKYELDSLCYPVLLAHQIVQATGRTDHLDASFTAAAGAILDTWDIERDHDRRSSYRFLRPGESLARRGQGTPTAPTGLIWSGFRPSDDRCERHYLVPANAMAAVAAGHLADLLESVGVADLAVRARAYATELPTAIAAHGVSAHPEHGPVYVYETDGLGRHVLMDDANIPSLLSLPYLGWCSVTDPLYRATRRFVLSSGNPYYYTGSAACGIGSPHLGGDRYIWHLSLAMQGLTAADPHERAAALETLARTDGGTGLMHEGFHADDPGDFTRPWFAWANSLFAELALLHAGLAVPGTPATLLPEETSA
ncbi:glycoside hydrolase family 125 protein [Streptomyces composti]|nr:glycoside hydrolase family 125 protein [Streptomyces composti]